MIIYYFLQQVMNFPDAQMYHRMQHLYHPILLTADLTSSSTLRHSVQVDQNDHGRLQNWNRAERERAKSRKAQKRETTEIQKKGKTY